MLLSNTYKLEVTFKCSYVKKQQSHRVLISFFFKINRSKSRPFWQSARALRSRIAGSGGEKGRGLSLTPSLRPQLPLPRHCGTPRPEMANEVLPRSIWAPRRPQRARAPGGLEAPLESSVFEGQRSREGTFKIPTHFASPV